MATKKSGTETKLDELRLEIAKGLESGPSRPFDFDGLKKRARKKVARAKPRAAR
jgi:hypothetical protein